MNPSLWDRLEGAATTCLCLILDLPSGPAGLTEHDQALSVDGVVCTPGAFQSASGPESSGQFTPGQAGAVVHIEAADISEDALWAGVLDGVRVRLFRVDWEEPGIHALLWSGHVGDIEHRDGRWTLTLEGQERALDRVIGRVITRRCDADLGDARCGVDMDNPAFGRVVTGVEWTAADRFKVPAFSTPEPTHFLDGTAQLSGASVNAEDARVFGIRSVRSVGSFVEFTLTANPNPPCPQDRDIALRVGCDKRHGTCAARFQNAVNFQGFPYLPGSRWTAAYPRSGEPLDGGRLTRGSQTDVL